MNRIVVPPFSLESGFPAGRDRLHPGSLVKWLWTLDSRSAGPKIDTFFGGNFFNGLISYFHPGAYFSKGFFPLQMAHA